MSTTVPTPALSEKDLLVINKTLVKKQLKRVALVTGSLAVVVVGATVLSRYFAENTDGDTTPSE
jgi:hypothetical protein